MLSIVTSIRHDHDPGLLLLAILVCAIGAFATYSVSAYAGRLTALRRTAWMAVGIVSAGATAWAVQMIALIAYRAPARAAIVPNLAGAALVAAILLVGTGTKLALGTRTAPRRLAAGTLVGCGVVAVHYLGQLAYVAAGRTGWDAGLALPSTIAGGIIAGIAVMAVSGTDRWSKGLAAPLLLGALALLHFGGMAAIAIIPDARVALPASALFPQAVEQIVAGVTVALLALALMGMRFDLRLKAMLRHDRDRLRELADVALEGLLICEGDRIVTVNRSFELLFGTSREQLANRTPAMIFPGLNLATLPEREEREAEIVRDDGQRVPVRVLRSAVALGADRQTVIAVRDQRERLRTEAQIRTLAFSDPLTGLPNRTRFCDLLSLHVATRRGNGTGCSVLLIDLDRFKPVNDTLGHAAGDMLLRKVAERLTTALDEGDVVARIGGDEFAVLHLGDDPESAGRLAGRIVQDVGDLPYMLDGNLVHVGASVGVAVAPADGGTPPDLLRNADLALYAAKADGRGAYRLFDTALDARMQAKRTMEAGLRGALAGDELELHFQPLAETGSGRITSAEALVRWRDPVRGLVPPGEFIALAEETGLILPLGEWVLRTACEEAVRWPSHMSVAINLSPVQFREPKLADMVKSALRLARLHPSRLELEITEGVVLNDDPQTLATLMEIRDMGVRISMDDFGTGYSSISYLRRFPFDKIKVDQSFVRQLPHDPESVAIVRAIITMGACLGMTTTMEGVETSELLAFATAEGCMHIQGFLISQPLPARNFRAMIERDGGYACFAEGTRALAA